MTLVLRLEEALRLALRGAAFPVYGAEGFPVPYCVRYTDCMTTINKLGMGVFALTLGVCALAVPMSARAQTAGFPDVPQNHWAAQAVAKLASAGIVNGYPADPLQVPKTGQAKPTTATGFNGNKPVTRYELAVTLYRFVQYMERANSRPKSKGGASTLPPATSGADAVRRLVAGGYLPKDTPLAKEGGKTATANELIDALTAVIAKDRANATPITPDSLRTLPQEHPKNAPGT